MQTEAPVRRERSARYRAGRRSVTSHRRGRTADPSALRD
jgi:hypothetical protein